MDVVGLGYCVYDILAIVPGPPDFENVGMAPLADLVVDGGGQVGTALTALSRLGAEVGYLGLLGDDTEGRWLQDLFVSEGVDITRLRRQDQVGTNICLILVDQATARRSILCHRRVHAADLVLDQEDRAYIQSARVLHLDGQFMPAAIQAARWAKRAGVKVSYDGNHPRPGLDNLLPLVDWLVVAKPFPSAYTGLHDPREAAHALLALGAEIVVATHGEQGCELWTATTHLKAPALPIQAVDTTGAGDAFHGAFIYGMLEGWELQDVAAFSNAVAGLNCSRLGGRRGLPTLAQVNTLLAGS